MSRTGSFVSDEAAAACEPRDGHAVDRGDGFGGVVLDRGLSDDELAAGDSDQVGVGCAGALSGDESSGGVADGAGWSELARTLDVRA